MSGCYVCQKSKAPYKCGICESTICKSCALFRGDDNFTYLTNPAADLTHDVYCSPCFDLKVGPELEKYKQTLHKAKNINVFFKDQGKETRRIKRTESPVKVEHCPDRDEAILRLAFVAAQGGFNAIIDVDLAHIKIRNEAYQTMVYNASGVPANVDEKRVWA